MTTTSTDVANAAAAYAQAQAAADAAREAMNETIRAASAAGVPLRELIEATGLTKQRIHQIRHQTR